MIDKLLDDIFKYADTCDRETDFQEFSDRTAQKIFDCRAEKFISLITTIGVIPEIIEHDSREEKLFTKTAEIILARCFNEIGLKSTLYTTRSNTADVFAESRYHNYSLVADAKSFRLSRTAKNQKDFKVESLDAWRHDNDYAVLCCPYFQYPRKHSAIYKQALDCNVSLFSWEYFRLLIENDVRESPSNDLSPLWNFSAVRAERTVFNEADQCFLNEQDSYLAAQAHISVENFDEAFDGFRLEILSRGEIEIAYWEDKISEIKGYSRKEAIDALLNALKLNKKIKTIKKFMAGLGYEGE